ncbi:unnamed protein product [Caenorhabditis auriculariae]|uniref:DB module n=1 Tax=Caenorhabditis auriculariae TaxID=2777116 RepID=A0A8S1GVK7_9PELO|nr:unnamed protein product [Caenorhabditis auriculariae]
MVQSTVLIFALFYLSVDGSRVPCCLKSGVPSHCATALCDASKVPGDMERYTLFEGRRSCVSHLPKIAVCISDGHDSLDCCKSNAEDAEDDVCFGLCTGQMQASVSRRDFKSCFAVNSEAIFKCLLDSQTNAPSEPTNFRFERKSSSSVLFSWTSPERNSATVQVYKLHIMSYEKDVEVFETIHDTKLTSLEVNNLKPEFIYSAFVVAHSENKAGKAELKSVKSPVLHFSTAPEGKTLSIEKVSAPATARRTWLYCKLRLSVDTVAHVLWEKEVDGIYHKVDGERFLTTSYKSETTPEYVLSALQISDLQATDFTKYRCHIKKQRHQYGMVDLVESSITQNTAPDAPIDTVAECCSKAPIKGKCKSVCTSAKVFRRRTLRPGNLLPNPSCVEEFHTLMQCALSDLNSAACCIHSQVPYKCLGMCDNNFTFDSSRQSECLEYFGEAFACQSAILQPRPSPVSFVTTSFDSSADETVFSWEPSEKTNVYYVFSRSSGKPWSRQTITTTTALVKSADEVSIVASNEYGVSVQNRQYLLDGEWGSGDI